MSHLSSLKTKTEPENLPPLKRNMIFQSSPFGLPAVSFLGSKTAQNDSPHMFAKLLYFEWSPPWHVGWWLSGGGCQGVHPVLLAAAQIIFAISHESSLASHSSGEHLANIYRKKHNSSMSVDLLKQDQKLLRQQQRMLKHAKTCQDTTCQTYTRKQKSNMSVDLLKQDQKLLRQQRCMLKHAKTCQETTCQTYTRKQKSNMSVDLLKQDQNLLRQQRCMLKHAKTCQDTPCQTYQ